jgi:aminoglycoside phosphotransferase (APT) family kinase protein
LPAALQGDTALAGRLGAAVIDALARLHRVDPVQVGLDQLGKPDGFVARQLAGWAKRWDTALDRERPESEALLRWFEAGVPASRGVSLLHNDYKLDNLLLGADDPATPVAVLDWDMCTRGDPLMDLGYLLNYWAEPGDPEEWIAASAMPTWRPGFPSRAEVIARYADRTGFEIASLGWYRAFAVFKLAVILQQIYIRYLRGQTTDPRFAGFGERVGVLLRKAEALAGIG